MAPSRTTPFQPKHALEYGLELVSTGPSGDQTVRCNFSAFEGRDKVDVGLGSTRKRKNRSTIHYFKKPFKPESYRNTSIDPPTPSFDEDEDEDEEGQDVAYAATKTIACLAKEKVKAMECLIEDEGSFARSSQHGLDVDDKAAVLKEIVVYVERLVVGLNAVRAERDDNNKPLEKDATPVLPGQLVQFRPGRFVRDVLDPIWSDEDTDNIEADQRELYAAYNGGDAFLKAAIDKHDLSTTFDEAWDVTSGRWCRLCSFCCGLATVFPNTTSVESDYSILKREMDENRTDMMHLFLEGIFQAKQRNTFSRNH
ncbi:hypothetical protein ACHHYP_10873 [Achlya hypogyna]|uniref:Uncharacterized protein n=1 Tax=Achlya hypogyna TaxID=1202772 RepID=A0A1V9YKF9_ACHHY|nr:hypothetical protein ACHHYP_10873 [Achlya hypogyna]